MKNGNVFRDTMIKERHQGFRCSIVLGNQWGDEGKGKITDILAQMSDVIVRFNGGHNAGHTVKVGKKEFDLHILPSGMVSEGKTNIITSSCVLGVRLNKIDVQKIKISEKGVFCNATLEDILKRDEEKKPIEVGMIPELEKLREGGIDISKSGLKISGETVVIGMHNVLLDAFDEKCREAGGLGLIGSTGSGISRAYASEMQRYHFSLNDLLYNENAFYDSIKTLWLSYKCTFPNISYDELIKEAKRERKELIKYLKNGDIEVIRNERDYIKQLYKEGKRIIGEGAQSSMIGSGNSFFGTASDPSLQTFMNATGLTCKKVGNIFLVHKMPPSSVGNRPGFLKYPETEALNNFRDQYDERGVSTGRARDLFYYSLPETARGAGLNVRGIDDESKIVPVFNRVDGIEDALALDPSGILRVVVGYDYKVKDILNGNTNTTISVGINGCAKVNPKEVLKNYPEKSAQSMLFGVKESNLRFLEIGGNDIQEKINTLLGYHLGAIYRKNEEREYLIGTGPSRDDLEMRKGTPKRNINISYKSA